MKSINNFFPALCLNVLVLVFASTHVFATTDTILFGGINPGKNFKTSTLDVKIGDTILWVGFFGTSDPFHILQSVSVPPGAASFGPVISGQTFAYPVTVAGDYNYQCNIHCCGKAGNMQGSFTAAVAEVKDAAANEAASLEKNFPNPFSTSTTIRYTLNRASPVTLRIFDLNGKEVNILINKPENAGKYEIPFDGTTLPSGTYIYQLQTGEAILTRQMLLLKK